jgi:hypothetical protein
MEQDRVVRDHVQAVALDIANQRRIHIMANQLPMALGAADVHAAADEVLRSAAGAVGASGDAGKLLALLCHIMPLQRHN